MRKLILNDGRELECLRCAVSSGILWVKVAGLTLVEAVILFSDPEKTKVMTDDYGDGRKVHEGFTVQILAQVQEDGILMSFRRE